MMNSLAEPVGGYDVRVEPVDGPARPMAMLLAQSVVNSFAEKEIAATINKRSSSNYVLSGKSTANWDDPRAPFIIIIHWTLSDAQGKTVGTYVQGVRGEWSEWENGDPRIIRAVGQEAAEPFAEMVKEKEEVVPPAELRGAALIVNNVTGAPGDGDVSLTAAIKDALNRTDVSVTEDQRQVDFMLQGVVEISPPQNNQQAVRVTWTVLTPAGAKVGDAIQENMVPVGSLDGVWGKTATYVAAAAIRGIEDILARASMLRNKQPNPGKQESGTVTKQRSAPYKSPPPPARLKQIPGKAPPPPL